MTIQERIQFWPVLVHGGSFANVPPKVNPATDVIKDVQVAQDSSNQKFIKIEVQTVDNRAVSITIPFKQVIPPEQDVIDRVINVLRSAIGKTLDDTGKMSA